MISLFPENYVRNFFSEHSVYNFPKNEAETPERNDDFEYTSEPTTSIKAVLLKFAYKHKKLILAIPFVRKIALKFRTNVVSMLATSVVSVFVAEHYMPYDDIDFIKFMYYKMLGRIPSSDELLGKLIFLNKSNKHAMVYCIYISNEFAGRFRLKNLRQYRTAYRNYRIKSLLRFVPIVNTYIKIKSLEKQLAGILNLIKDNFYATNHNISGITAQQMLHGEQLSGITAQQMLHGEQLSGITAQQTLHGEQLSGITAQQTLHGEQLSGITAQQTLHAQLITGLHEKSDNSMRLTTSLIAKFEKYNGIFEPYVNVIATPVPEKYISKGILGVESYLKQARADLTDNDKQFLNTCSDNDKFYFYMSKLFRGSEETLFARFDNYLDEVTLAFNNTGKLPVLDLGCGKGDWLRFLRNHNIIGKGVDFNIASAQETVNSGFEVIISEIAEYLIAAKDNSFGVITLFEVAEHLTRETFDIIMKEISRVVAPGGLFILETPNPFCFFAYGGFYTDPSHILWVSPDAAKLQLEMYGFDKVEFIFYAPYDWIDKSSEPIKNYQGYAIVAGKTLKI